MKNVEDLGLIQRLRLRLNDWRILRKLRDIRALLVSCGYDPRSADDAVVKIIQTLPVPAFYGLPASEEQRHRARVVGMWVTDREMYS